jgi:hypothetical protein
MRQQNIPFEPETIENVFGTRRTCTIPTPDFKKAREDYRTLCSIYPNLSGKLTDYLQKAVQYGLITDAEKTNIEIASICNM